MPLFILSTFSAQACAGTPELGSQAILCDVVQGWRNLFNAGQSVPNEGRLGHPVLAKCLPIPHAMLCSHGHWLSWALPALAKGRRACGLGYHHIKPWLRGLDLPAAANHGNHGGQLGITYSLGPDLLQNIADVIRSQAAGVGSDDDIRFVIQWAQDLRDRMFRNALGNTKSMYDMTEMVHYMGLAGMLGKRSSMKSAVQACLDAFIQEPEIKQYYATLLEGPHTTPSMTTIYRHRLTIHMAYCRCAQERLQQMLDEGGVCRWGTMDSSPQSGHNWMMIGYACMRTIDLVPSLELAHLLYHLRNDDSEEAVLQTSSQIKLRQIETQSSVITRRDK